MFKALKVHELHLLGNWIVLHGTSPMYGGRGKIDHEEFLANNFSGFAERRDKEALIANLFVPYTRILSYYASFWLLGRHQ